MTKNTQQKQANHGKVFSLHLHKNTRDKRHRHELRKQLVMDAKAVGTKQNFAGYLIIGWDEDANACATSNGTQCSPIPGSLLPAYVNSVLMRCLSEHDRT